MLETFLTVLPLNLASTLSPGILALTLVLLGGKERQKLRVFSLLLGSLLAGVIIVGLGLTLGSLVPEGIGQNKVAAIVDLALGAFFLFFAVKVLSTKERKLKEQEGKQGWRLRRWAIVGFIISITNFDAVFLSFTAAKEVGSDADTDSIEKLILVVVNLLFFILPITLPLLMYMLFPDFAARVLTRVNQFVQRYSKYIIFALFVIFGVMLLYRGIAFFL